MNIANTRVEPFKDLEEIHQTCNEDLNQDDETVTRGNKYTSTRIQIMVSTQATEKSAEALLKATRELVSALQEMEVKVSTFQNIKVTSKKERSLLCQQWKHYLRSKAS